MTHQLDYIIIALRLVVDVPIVYFLFQQWYHRKRNGSIRLVRNMVTLWVVMFFLQFNYSLIVRFISTKGVDTQTPKFDMLAFVFTICMLFATVYAIRVYQKIIKEHE